jgi:glycosyltransferase involved in cell wall biosynthesis
MIAKKYIFITNIPAPYRITFYNKLQEGGLEFEVLYMREREADRQWLVDKNAMRHSYYIDRGLYGMIGHYHFHFNPKIIYKLLKKRHDEFIIAGGWNDIDVLILVILKRLGIINNKFHFWTEANYLTIGSRNDNFLKKIIRKFVYGTCDGGQLKSGQMTAMTLKKWGIRVNRYINLPNTIEQQHFSISNADILSRTKNPLPILVMPVRLNEKVKGVVNFLKAIGDHNIKRVLILIAGDGPDRGFIEDFIRSHDYIENVKVLGHCNVEKMVEIYRCANIFVLPSFSDPCPLTINEALAMKLPLLVSQMCGNHFEAVIEGENGYTFDPFDLHSIRESFVRTLERERDWEKMGKKSGDIYFEKFEITMLVEKFISELTCP